MCGDLRWVEGYRMIHEENSRSKAEGQKITIQALENWRRGQEKKNEGGSKTILKQTRKTRHNVHSYENIKRKSRKLQERKMLNKTE